MDNITLTVQAKPVNESLARSVIAAFATRANPTLDIVNDIKTAVSEAVTNAVVHAYPEGKAGEIRIKASLEGKILKVEVSDFGVGIEDVTQAMADYFTSKPGDERSGLGFTIMSGFMDTLSVQSVVGQGATVTMTKNLA
jgi:stage II sporulation protein AB (anti-sigma F factor)